MLASLSAPVHLGQVNGPTKDDLATDSSSLRRLAVAIIAFANLLLKVGVHVCVHVESL